MAQEFRKLRVFLRWSHIVRTSAERIRMPDTKVFSSTTIVRDLTAGLVVFLVALPLCLGVALASGAPLFSGLLAGIVGGVLVGILSGSHTSVSGPAAGLTAIVSVQIVALGSFDAFLLAVVIAGLIQIGLGVARAGSLSAFFPICLDTILTRKDRCRLFSLTTKTHCLNSMK